MSLNRAGQRIQMPSSRMWRDSLPFWKRSSRRLNRRVNIRNRTLSDRRKLVSSRRIDRIEEPAIERLMPFPVDEVTKASLMLVEPL